MSIEDIRFVPKTSRHAPHYPPLTRIQVRVQSVDSLAFVVFLVSWSNPEAIIVSDGRAESAGRRSLYTRRHSVYIIPAGTRTYGRKTRVGQWNVFIHSTKAWLRRRVRYFRTRPLRRDRVNRRGTSVICPSLKGLSIVSECGRTRVLRRTSRPCVNVETRRLGRRDRVEVPV